jgi:cytoskeletal protein CcmA (bactofilin family)
MQGLVLLICLLAQALGPSANSEVLNDTGMMPEVIVTAQRYEGEDIAYSGMMPETVVTAPRFEGEDIAYSGMMPEVTVVADRRINQTKYIDSQIKKEQTYFLAYATEPAVVLDKSGDDIDVTVKFAGLTFSGNYDLAEGDTIDEDVTVTGGNAKIAGVICADLAVMGGTVDISGMVCGDVAVFGGNLDIQGSVAGDAAVFGGHVHNKGTLEGDIFVVGGTISLDSGSVVNGDISMVGGSVDRDTNAVVLGKIESVEMDVLEKLLPRIGRIGRAFDWTKKLPGGGVLGGFIGIAVLLVIYILNLLVLLIFPQPIDHIVEKVQRNVWASVGFGLGIQILFIPLIVLFAVSVIGIPLIPLFVLAVNVAVLFGFSALSLTIGDKIIKGFNWQIQSRVGTFSIGWITLLLILILGFILHMFGLLLPPIFALGGVIIYVAATIGIGGVIYALVKREGKRTKKDN